MGSKPPRSYLPADYSQVAQTDPQSHLASGLAEAFRSSETPPFGQMLGTLFATQMANDARNLNTLLSALGPSMLASGGLSSLAGLLRGGNSMTPEQPHRGSAGDRTATGGARRKTGPIYG